MDNKANVPLQNTNGGSGTSQSTANSVPALSTKSENNSVTQQQQQNSSSNNNNNNSNNNNIQQQQPKTRKNNKNKINNIEGAANDKNETLVNGST